jgi:hypothetical protein
MGALRGSAACFPRQRTVRNISITKIAKSGKTHKKVFFHTPRDNDNDRKNVWTHTCLTRFLYQSAAGRCCAQHLLQEVVVTANKPQVPEDIFETWSPRTFDYEEIERKGISSLEDVLRRMPGSIVKNGQAYLMRGGTVGFFIDGTYFQPMGRRPERDPLLGAMPHDRPRRALELQLLHQRQQRHRLHAHHRGHHPGRRAHQQAHHHRQALTTTFHP